MENAISQEISQSMQSNTLKITEIMEAKNYFKPSSAALQEARNMKEYYEAGGFSTKIMIEGSLSASLSNWKMRHPSLLDYQSNIVADDLAAASERNPELFPTIKKLASLMNQGELKDVVQIDIINFDALQGDDRSRHPENANKLSRITSSQRASQIEISYSKKLNPDAWDKMLCSNLKHVKKNYHLFSAERSNFDQGIYVSLVERSRDLKRALGRVGMADKGKEYSIEGRWVQVSGSLAKMHCKALPGYPKGGHLYFHDPASHGIDVNKARELSKDKKQAKTRITLQDQKIAMKNEKIAIEYPLQKNVLSLEVPVPSPSPGGSPGGSPGASPATSAIELSLDASTPVTESLPPVIDTHVSSISPQESSPPAKNHKQASEQAEGSSKVRTPEDPPPPYPSEEANIVEILPTSSSSVTSPPVQTIQENPIKLKNGLFDNIPDGEYSILTTALPDGFSRIRFLSGQNEDGVSLKGKTADIGSELLAKKFRDTNAKPKRVAINDGRLEALKPRIWCFGR